MTTKARLNTIEDCLKALTAVLESHDEVIAEIRMSHADEKDRSNEQTTLLRMIVDSQESKLDYLQSLTERMMQLEHDSIAAQRQNQDLLKSIRDSLP